MGECGLFSFSFTFSERYCPIDTQFLIVQVSLISKVCYISVNNPTRKEQESKLSLLFFWALFLFLGSPSPFFPTNNFSPPPLLAALFRVPWIVQSTYYSVCG
jgi:hypothetical protein